MAAFTVAFIGLKGHQYVAIQDIAELSQVEIVAAADDEPESLRHVPGWSGASSHTKTYLDWRELLANHTPDVVVEASTCRDRADIIIACAARGIHVMCEKPMAIDLAGLARVRTAVRDAGIRCTMLLQLRAEPQYLAMKHALETGIVGTVTQLGGQKSYRLGTRPSWQQSHQTFSGIVPFVGIHLMDVCRWLSGREYVEVMAYYGNTGHPDIGDLEDNGCILAKLDNGGSAAFRLDYCRPAAAPSHGDDRVRIIGNRGVIEARDGIVTTISHEEGPMPVPQPRPVALFADFVKAIRQPREPYISFRDCAHITEVVLRARESAEIGKPVKLSAPG